MSLPTTSVDSIDPGSDITWPNAINPDFFKNYPSESQMRSWPWPGTSSTPPPLQDDYSDTEESAYEKVQRENIMEKEKRLAELGIQKTSQKEDQDLIFRTNSKIQKIGW